MSNLKTFGHDDILLKCQKRKKRIISTRLAVDIVDQREI